MYRDDYPTCNPRFMFQFLPLLKHKECTGTSMVRVEGLGGVIALVSSVIIVKFVQF